MASAVGSGAAVPFWRAAGMTYISYSNICANLVRNCLKEPFKSEVLTREKVHFSISKWDNGVPQKPTPCGLHVRAMGEYVSMHDGNCRHCEELVKAIRSDTPEED